MKKSSKTGQNALFGFVVWVEGEIRWYEVVSKHSKRVPACEF